MKDFIIKHTILRNRIRRIKEKQKLYDSIKSEKDIYQYQLDKFNKIWSKAIRNTPFYIKWKKKHSLPDKVSSLDELKGFPILTKKDIQENYKLIFQDLKNYSIASTGGSTGEPIRIPKSNFEETESYANAYLGRGWWEVKPLETLLTIWGHSHLFGSWIKGRLNQYKRVLSDMLINIKRLSAYDVSKETLSKYYKILKKSNPVALLGYTSAIYKLARYVKDYQLDVGNKSSLKGVIITSETATQTDINLINDVFKVPAIIEYGLSETGVVAYSDSQTDNIKVFWDSFVAQLGEQNILNLTSISNRLFPLINYSTDDIVEEKKSFKGSLLSFKKIFGRKHDFLTIQLLNNNLVAVHGEFFTHIIKSIKGVYSFKIIQKKDGNIIIKCVISKDITLSQMKKSFFDEIRKEFKDLDLEQFSFQQVENLDKTIAGKEKFIEIE